MTDSFHIFAHKGVGWLSESWEGGYFKSFDSDSDNPTNVGKTRINHPPNQFLCGINHSQMGDVWHCFSHIAGAQAASPTMPSSCRAPKSRFTWRGDGILGKSNQHMCTTDFQNRCFRKWVPPNTFFEVTWNTTKTVPENVLHLTGSYRFIAFPSFSHG